MGGNGFFQGNMVLGRGCGLRGLAFAIAHLGEGAYYVLSFVPAADPDGVRHHLKVKLEGKSKFTVEARTGYYAPGR